MSQPLPGSATTTHTVRAELQRSKTVIKWRTRQSVEKRPMGPIERCSAVLSPAEEGIHLSASRAGVILHHRRRRRPNSYRCLQRHLCRFLAAKPVCGGQTADLRAEFEIWIARQPSHIPMCCCLTHEINAFAFKAEAVAGNP